MKKGQRTMSWRTRLALLLVVFSVTPAMMVAWLATDQMAKAATQTRLSALKALAVAKAEAIDGFTDYRRSDVERLAKLVSPRFAAVKTTEADAAEAKKNPKAPEPVSPPEKLPPLKDAEQLEPGPDGGATDRERPDGDEPNPPEPKQDAETPEAPGPTPEEQSVDDARSDLKQMLRLLLWDQSSFEELLVIDVEGRVVAATFDGHEGRSATELEYFRQGMKATFVQPVFKSPITEQLTMVIATPIRSAEGNDLGVLAARLNLSRFFALIGDVTGLGASGETVVGKLIDDKFVFMAPTRHDAEAALKRFVEPGAELAMPLQEGARSHAGQGTRRDYRNIEVLAAWQPVPSLGWGLVVKIDNDEAMASVTDARRTMLLISLVVIALAIVASFAAARALVKPLNDLKTAVEKISKGDFAIELQAKSDDEFGELADSFERMVAAIKFFRDRSQKLPPELDEETEG